MPGQDLQLAVDLVPFRLDESEAVDRGTEDAFQVMVVGFVVAVGRQTIMPRGEGMDQTRFAAGLAKGALHGAMVGAGHLHGHEVVLQAVLLDRFAELRWSPGPTRRAGVRRPSAG